MDPTKYLNKMMGNFDQMFGREPKQSSTPPLDENNHPELDQSEFLDKD